MKARRKKSAPARRITGHTPWDAELADLFLAPDDWTPPAQIKVVHGKAGGTFSAVFTDTRGGRAEAYARVRFLKSGGARIVEQGLRQSFRFHPKDSAK